ncbi:hypothetical protein evm_010810 [Chilo suppressalis]|nr:hypothetical protein evm_010810 [Chilo suppressalis]
MKGVTDKIGRILKRASINTYFKPPKKINQFLRPVKCNIPFQVAGVYKLECDCGLSFIGQTKRSIGTRVKEHIADMKHRRENKSAVCEHALGGPKHYIRFDKPQILATEQRFIPRMIREAIEIKKYPNFNREDGYHARNVQLITDADLNILHVDPTFGGATHDSFIFNYSIIKDHLHMLTNNGEEVVLLGDSGYAQRAYLMTPISDVEDSSPEALYNSLHATARNSVERAIGLLKGRFRCLLVHRILDYHPDVVAKIVIACCVLHNICNRAGMPVYDLSDEERLEEAQIIVNNQRRQTSDLPTNADLAIGQLRRRNLVNTLWRSHYT